MPPRAGKTRVVAHPDEVVGPQIEHPLEITFAVALVALPQRVRLAGDATLLSSAEIPTKRRYRRKGQPAFLDADLHVMQWAFWCRRGWTTTRDTLPA
jgi:hypothetical protein